MKTLAYGHLIPLKNIRTRINKANKLIGNLLSFINYTMDYATLKLYKIIMLNQMPSEILSKITNEDERDEMLNSLFEEFCRNKFDRLIEIVDDEHFNISSWGNSSIRQYISNDQDESVFTSWQRNQYFSMQPGDLEICTDLIFIGRQINEVFISDKFLKNKENYQRRSELEDGLDNIISYLKGLTNIYKFIEKTIDNQENDWTEFVKERG